MAGKTQMSESFRTAAALALVGEPPLNTHIHIAKARLISFAIGVCAIDQHNSL